MPSLGIENTTRLGGGHSTVCPTQLPLSCAAGPACRSRCATRLACYEVEWGGAGRSRAAATAAACWAAPRSMLRSLAAITILGEFSLNATSNPDVTNRLAALRAIVARASCLEPPHDRKMFPTRSVRKQPRFCVRRPTESVKVSSKAVALR